MVLLSSYLKSLEAVCFIEGDIEGWILFFFKVHNMKGVSVNALVFVYCIIPNVFIHSLAD